MSSGSQPPSGQFEPFDYLHPVWRLWIYWAGIIKGSYMTCMAARPLYSRLLFYGWQLTNMLRYMLHELITALAIGMLCIIVS